MCDLIESESPADVVSDAVVALVAELVCGRGLRLEDVMAGLVMDGLALVAAVRGLELAIATGERATANLRSLRHAPGWRQARMAG